MDTPSSYTKRFGQLRWKLTLSYTGVTVGALLTLELILLASTAIVVAVLLNSGVIQTELINAVSNSYMPPLQFLLSQTPPDQDEITDWLGRMSAAVGPTIPLTFNANEKLLIVGHDGVLLGSSPQDLLGSDTIGNPINMQALPGLAAPLQAALGGEEDVNNLYNTPGPEESVILAIPIWDEAHEGVLGVLIAVGEFPTVQSALSTIIPIMGGSFLIFTLIAGIAGTIYGSISARGLSTRLNRLSDGTHAWSQGDFTQLVEDTSGDEIGQLAYNLNQMAQELESLLDTRQELVQIEERNRMARDLHDSVKQQAFAASAQISTARKLLAQNSDKATENIEQAERLTNALRKELTNMIQDLRSPALEGKGLAAALQDYSQDWSRQNEINLEIRLQGERPLPLDIEQTVFRIVQEALANVARHSNADKVEIILVYTSKELTCMIHDNGPGFDPTQASPGFGIRSMQERAKALGSQLDLESTAGEGTTIRFSIKLKDNPSHIEENQIHG
ncbi:MAG TPA: histidine kinase [Anaerolineales bacterium]|nr:histidine kinase [Anaerolineales bacterium]